MPLPKMLEGLKDNNCWQNLKTANQFTSWNYTLSNKENLEVFIFSKSPYRLILKVFDNTIHKHVKVANGPVQLILKMPSRKIVKWKCIISKRNGVIFKYHFLTIDDNQVFVYQFLLDTVKAIQICALVSIKA